LTLFFEFIGSKVLDGTVDESIVEEDEGLYSFGLTPQSHLIDDLKRHFLPQKTVVASQEKTVEVVKKSWWKFW